MAQPNQIDEVAGNPVSFGVLQDSGSTARANARGVSPCPLEMSNLVALMTLTTGAPNIVVALIDGPVVLDHPNLATENIRYLVSSTFEPTATIGAATSHGTFIAGILAARRGSAAPAICPACTFLIRPIFFDPPLLDVKSPGATPNETADAIAECIDAGATLINLSSAVAQPSPNREPRLEESLHYAGHRGAIVIAAAGNQATLGSSAITRHPAVIPVAASNRYGQPTKPTNLGASIARKGLCAPGEAITSLGPNHKTLVTSNGTSVAAPFVTGTAALLWSAFPGATAGEIRNSLNVAEGKSRKTIVPPLLDARAAYQRLAVIYSSGRKYER